MHLKKKPLDSAEGQLWIELVGNIIVARIRGIPTEDLIRETQERILQLIKDTEQGSVLYDTLEMEAPSVEVPLSQCQLDKDCGVRLRRAIVVPNTKLAYLARLAFGEGGEYRVFYNDLAAAINWLQLKDHRD